MLGLFLVEEEKIFFFSASYFRFLPCLIKLRAKKYVFFSALYSPKAKIKATTLGPFDSFLTLPMIALVGAKPAFFALQNKDFRRDNTFCQSESERQVQKIERKALSWLKKKNDFFVAHKNNFFFFFFEPKHSKERPKVETGKVHYAPFTYILVNDQLEAGKTVINYDWSKPSTLSNHHQSSHNLTTHKDLQFQDHFVYTTNESQGSPKVEEPVQSTQATP